MNRSDFISRIAAEKGEWDMVIIGGGATGLGIAMDASARGYKTLLLEQADFAKGTSSRSTKLVHGGVRYLAQGNIGLVLDALHERGLLLKNAPHLVNNLAFVIPYYKWWQGPFYTIGLKLYDLLSGRLSFGRSKHIGRKAVEALLPVVERKQLKGGILYHDGQFDDARLALNIAQTAAENGGVLLNYYQVEDLLKENGKIKGVKAKDIETGQHYTIRAKAVINATGVFVDDILQMDDPHAAHIVKPSQGVHVVLDQSFLRSDHAVMIPKTADGRVLFAVPWHHKVLVGTTDTPLEKHSLEPKALDQEIDFILRTAGSYLSIQPTRRDVLSVFAGLRPLAAPGKDTESTKEISRSHKIIVSSSGLITITGGKWTTFRRMAEDAVNKAVKVHGLPFAPCTTQNLRIHGYTTTTDPQDVLQVYGSDAAAIRRLAEQQPWLGERLHPRMELIKAQVVWAVQQEMARTVEDVLARRLRVLFLDARAAMDMAPAVAMIMAGELGKDQAWQEEQVSAFITLAHDYLLEPYAPASSLLENAGG